MTTVDPTQPPSTTPAPDLPTLISAYWNAKHLADHWKAQEKQARLALADALSSGHDGYKNKTMDLGTHKLRMDVTRDIKIDFKHPEFLKWWNAPTTTNEQRNAVAQTVPASLKASLSGYNTLSVDEKNLISPAVRISELVSIKFDEIKDER